jgi:hypothetical protein
VWVITRQPCVGAAPLDVASEAARYVPADAVTTTTTTNDDGLPVIVYMSPSVASAVPADMFVDCEGNLVTPGTFLVESNFDGGWSMEPGSCP